MPVGDRTAVVGPRAEAEEASPRGPHMLLWMSRADGLRCGWECTLVTVQLCVNASP